MLKTTNRHELKRLATRDALRELALARFAERGFDNVTVAELAEEVGVTERTFYRHFPTKEAVLFQDYDRRLEWLSAALALRPASEPLFDAVLIAVGSFPHDPEIVHQAAVLRASITTGERIDAHLRVVQSSFASVLTEFVRARYADHPDIELEAQVAGQVLAAALVAAVEAWGGRSSVADLGDMVARALGLVRSGLGQLA